MKFYCFILKKCFRIIFGMVLSASVPPRATCERVLGHVFSTRLKESVKWAWSVERVRRVNEWETKIRRMTVKSQNGEGWVDDGREECGKDVECNRMGYLYR